MAFNGKTGDGPHSKRICIGINSENIELLTENSTNSINGNANNVNNNNNSEEPRRKRHEGSRPNHILLFTIINPVYPITVEVLHTICHPHGQVRRIVIFKKNGVQAMVEFDSIEAATRVRDNLNQCDIYSGCCTLKIDYAKPEKLNVYKNDVDTSWDYTLVKDIITNGRSPLLQDPLFGTRSQLYSTAPLGKEPLVAPGTAFTPYAASEYQTVTETWKAASGHPGLMKDPPIIATRNGQANFVTQGQQQQNAVMMVYGLDSSTSNTDKLFNLICLYGNVARIKFLKTKEGTAMVQMGDSVAVERCVQHLSNIPVGNSGKLQIAFSKQNFLSEVTNPFCLPDHSPSFKEYTGSKNNRFLSPAQASKNRIQPPSKILHFFNTPPTLTEDELNGIFQGKEILPSIVRLFPLKSERSSSGLIEFSSVAHAVLAIMKCNHTAIESKATKFPFIMKLCFSSTRNMNSAWNIDNIDKSDDV